MLQLPAPHPRTPTLKIALLARRLLRPVLDPYRRYRHARYIHAVRVAFGLLASILITATLKLPHSEWASVTMLIVMGGLQHHGNIGKKCIERTYGTLIGAALGLAVVAQQDYFGMTLLTYLLMSSICGFFAYHAIGRGGYTALLSAITLFIVAGHGNNPLVDGLWRTVDIFIGIALALAFSFALPLYAVYSWRYNLAKGLRDCAAVHKRILNGLPLNSDEHLKLTSGLTAVLVQLRSLMPSVSKEVGISTHQLDAIQDHLRLCISTLEILSSTRPDVRDAEALTAWQKSLGADHPQISRLLIGAARALKAGSVERLDKQPEIPAHAPAASRGQVALIGQHLLTITLLENVAALQRKLFSTAPKWKI